MIPRYTRPAFERLWSDERRYERWREIELLACEAYAELGVIPREAAASLRRRADFPIDRAFCERVEAIEREVDHDVIAFVSALAERVGEDGRYLHYGLTSYDVVDTALSWALVEAADLLLADVDELLAALARRAREFKDTPMMGRTHGIHAEPITFGLKLALWHAEMRRHRDRLARARETVRVGKVSGPVGTFSEGDPFVERYVCERVGLEPAPISTQVLGRDRHAEYVGTLALAGASIEKFATEIRHLARTEIREVEEPFGARQKGSSAMPHKRNPWRSERLAGLARLLRGYAAAAMETVVLWGERDMSNSSVERVALPDATSVLDFMLADFTRIVEHLVVHADRMRENLHAAGGGVVASSRVLLALVQAGLSREEAYRIVQAHAMAAWDRGESFRARCEADPEVAGRIGPDALDRCFDVTDQLRHVDTLFRRVGLSDEGSRSA